MKRTSELGGMPRESSGYQTDSRAPEKDSAFLGIATGQTSLVKLRLPKAFGVIFMEEKDF